MKESALGASSLGAVYVDVAEYFKKEFSSIDEYHALLAADGLHFRNQGHELIHDNLLLPVIDDILQSPR